MSAVVTRRPGPALPSGPLNAEPKTTPSESPTVPINDVTTAVQWLGANGGTPGIFVRTQGCTVGCRFCDVPETWHQVNVALRPDWKRRVIRWREMTGRQLAQWCRQNYQQSYVVVTGGEPAMHAGLNALCEGLLDTGYRVQLETSGTYEVTVPKEVWVTVSPKFNMAGRREVLESALRRANEIIMPITRESDYALLAQRVVPVLSRGTRVYLHPIRDGQLTAGALQAAFAQGYRLTAPMAAKMR